MKSASAAIIALFVLILGAAGPETGRLPNRTEDPVIVAGKNFPALAGIPAARLCVFRYDGKFSPIPFQVDERNRAGMYAYTKGPQPIKDETAGLDANDELVFMAFDLGAKAEGAPADAGPGAEIEVTDPVTGDRAYAYLYSFAGNAPRSTGDYVRYDTNARGTQSSGITWKTNYPPNSIYYTFQSIRRADGTWTPDTADRLKVRGELSAFSGMIQSDFQFDDLVKSRVTGWIDGPVRVVRRGEGYLAIGEMINIRGAGDSVAFNYPTWFTYPMMINFPVNLHTYINRMTIHGANDFTRAGFGLHYYDAVNKYHENIVIDGKMSAEEKKMNLTHDHSWLVLTSPQWSNVHRLFFPKEWSFIKKQVYYRDDPSKKDPPEDDPGEFAVGYDFTNFQNVSKGPVTYYMHYYFPAQFKVGDEKRILDVVDRPVRVKVTGL